MADAALGAVLGELLKAVMEAKEKAAMFKNVLERMECTMNSLAPIMKDIEELDKVLNHRKEETDPLMMDIEQGKTLVLKCSKISWWNCWQKFRYTKKLLKLENSLKSFFDIVIPAQQIRDFKENAVETKKIHGKVNDIHGEVNDTHGDVKDIHGKVNDIHGEVKDIHGEIKQLRERNDMIFNRSMSVAPCDVPEPPVVTVGLEVPLKDLKMKLLKDGVSMIVVSGLGGCGKTTLAKKLCRDQQVEGHVQKLFQHKGFQVPEFQSDEDAINYLGQLLKKIGPNPILLVLDDVWPESESMLEKFVFQLPYLKILVTSRSKLPRVDSTYHLQTLNDKDAMTLFRHSAFQQYGSPYIPNDVLNEIVKGCKGLPLALTVVGRSLCGQPAAIWQNKAMELSKGRSIYSERELLDCLRNSLDALDRTPIVKECYLDLGSFPEDQMIPATALIDMWMELYDLDEDDVSSIANLHELSTRNLVDLIVTRKDESEIDGYYNDYFVMQHDLLRELVNHLSNLEPIELRKRLIIDISENKFPKWWMEQKQQPICACLLSISTDEMFSPKWYNMQAPEVKVLVLNFRIKNYTLPKFIEQMHKLKVLIVSNYGFFPAELSNFSLLGSLSNLKRIRLEHVSFPSICLTNVQLKNLQKISLVMCSIGQAFTNNIQISYAFPNLAEINFDYCNDLVELPDGLCDIVYLKILSITYCHKLCALTQEIGKLENLQVLRLSSCIDLLELPDTIGSLYKLSILDISDCSSIKNLPKQFGELRNLRKLFMKGCSSELPLSVVNLKRLNDVTCDEVTATSWEPFKSHLTNLRIKVY